MEHGHSNKQIPCHTIVATFGKPSRNSPLLITHAGVEVFAHELGHAIHGLVLGVNGLKGPRDFVEIPSIFAENWVHVPQVLQRISRHYTYLKPEFLVAWQDRWKAKYPSKNLPPQPPREAPLDMFDEIKFDRYPKHDMNLILVLVWNSVLDVTIHGSTEEELKSMDLGVVCNKILEEWTGIFSVSEGKGPVQNNSYLHWSILKHYDTSAYCYLL